MALVKKLDSGGSIDYNLLDEELNSQIGSFNLKSKDERKVRNALAQFRNYMTNPQGKSFSVDQLTKQYSITGEGSEKFQGSPDEIKSG